MADKIKWFNEIIATVLNKNGIFYREKYVYHYTNLNSLISIIDNKELWLSERSCMNDINDEDFVRRLFKRLSQDYSFKDPSFLIHGEHQYLFSTSKENDSIHQWSYYGNGDGVCIEFDREKLINLFGKLFDWDGYYYGSILYTKEFEHDSIEKNIIIDIIKKFNETLNKKTDNIGEDQNIQFLIVSEYLYSLVKQYGHHCEQEYRFLITDEGIQAKLKNCNNPKIQKALETSFRSKSNLVAPFIKIPFNPKSLITSIMIGPNNHDKNAYATLRFYLDSKKLNNIKVTQSSLNTR